MARNAKKASDSLQPRRPHRYERLNKHEETPPEIGLWVRGIADSLLMVDQASRCLYANEAFAAFLKTTPEALTGKTVDEFLPEAHYPRFRREFARDDAKKMPVQFEEYHDGSRRWYECHCYPLAAGGMTVVLYDTTVRKQVEAALLESRRALEAAIVGSNAGVWRIDLDPQRPRFEPDYAYLSPQLKTLLGFTDEELPNSRSAWPGPCSA